MLYFRLSDSFLHLTFVKKLSFTFVKIFTSVILWCNFGYVYICKPANRLYLIVYICKMKVRIYKNENLVFRTIFFSSIQISFQKYLPYFAP